MEFSVGTGICESIVPHARAAGDSRNRTMKIVWLNDIHLNFLNGEQVRTFLDGLRAHRPDPDGSGRHSGTFAKKCAP